MHLENQDPANRTCGHIVNVGKQKRNKVLVPRKDWLAKLKAIKAASQATGVDVVIIARTDSIDGALPDQEPGGVKMAVEDAWEAAELGVDVIWPEFNNTELDQPQEFAEGVRKYYPDQMLGFNLSPVALLRKGQEGRHADHQSAARRPGLHPAVLDAVQLPHGRAWRWRKGCGSSSRAASMRSPIFRSRKTRLVARRRSPRCTRSSPA